MSNIGENALTVLRVMFYELELTIQDMTEREEILPLTQLDNDSYGRAISHLLHRNHLESTIGGNYLSLTPSGIQFLEQSMISRFPLSLQAEKILRYCEDELNSQQDNLFPRGQIMSVLGIEAQQFDKAFGLLESFGLINDRLRELEYRFVQISQQGRQAVHDNFRRPNSPSTQINAGAIIGEMRGGNVQAVAAAYESHIQQIINHSDAESLRKGINEAIEKLVNDVAAHLTLQQKAAYSQAAVKLQEEIAKPEPDRTVVERLMKVLSFGDTLGGTIELGDKMFTMLGKAAPYIGMIAPAIDQLYHSIPK